MGTLFEIKRIHLRLVVIAFPKSKKILMRMHWKIFVRTTIRNLLVFRKISLTYWNTRNKQTLHLEHTLFAYSHVFSILLKADH